MTGSRPVNYLYKEPSPRVYRVLKWGLGIGSGVVAAGFADKIVSGLPYFLPQIGPINDFVELGLVLGAGVTVGRRMYVYARDKLPEEDRHEDKLNHQDWMNKELLKRVKKGETIYADQERLRLMNETEEGHLSPIDDVYLDVLYRHPDLDQKHRNILSALHGKEPNLTLAERKYQEVIAEKGSLTKEDLEVIKALRGPDDELFNRVN